MRGKARISKQALSLLYCFYTKSLRQVTFTSPLTFHIICVPVCLSVCLSVYTCTRVPLVPWYRYTCIRYIPVAIAQRVPRHSSLYKKTVLPPTCFWFIIHSKAKTLNPGSAGSFASVQARDGAHACSFSATLIITLARQKWANFRSVACIS